jgi:reductive dehalogenase
LYSIAQAILFLMGLLVISLSLLFTVPSFSRLEVRAGIAGLVGALCGALLLAAAWMPFPGKPVLAGTLVVVGIMAGLILAIPLGQVQRVKERPSARVDERTIMFARRRLVPGMPQYETYYREHPEQKDFDDRIRAMPGLLSSDTPMADPLLFAAANAGFFLADSLRASVDGPVASRRTSLSPEIVSQYLKQLAHYFGARNSGIAEVKDYQVYSHIGRGSGTYGEAIALNHRFVIVFTFEMAEEMVRTAPRAEEAMETAHQYSEAAQTAIQVAAWIRGMGYEARAHIDGNYRLILPLAGRDAGLGEIGRMGLLMTPDLGPRVRLSAVTTTMPLIAGLPGDSPAVLDFCQICQKCAENCPSRAIPMGPRQEMMGALRWKIDAEKCFQYWNTVGTDCGRCLMVCPYSHANDPAHNLMRWLIARSGVARRLALRLDDWVYQRKPQSRPGPGWTRSHLRRQAD